MVLVKGRRRMRVPVRAAMALVSAGATVGTLTSPTPVGGSPDSIESTSIGVVHVQLHQSLPAFEEVVTTPGSPPARWPVITGSR
jgi:hypothetical protein